MAIRHRRGVYTDFDSSKIVAGELAVVLSNDPNSRTGKSVYVGTGPGEVKRLAFMEDTPGGTLPLPTSADSGKFLTVNSNGAWELKSIENAEGVSF